MTVEFPGYFDETVVKDGLIVVMPRPYILVGVEQGLGITWIEFLIDTGADASVIHPRDAYRIWGSEYLGWDFEDDDGRKTSHGVGGQTISTGRTMRLHFSTDGPVRDASFLCRVEIAQPDDRSASVYTNWNLPSLLGRDVLAHFQLYLTYTPSPRVVLTLET